MSNYVIKERTKRLAEKLNVQVRPSKLKGKKLDVYDLRGNKLASIGAAGLGDYPTYLLTDKALAEKKRTAYIARHAKDLSVVGSPGFFAFRLLWS